MECESKSDTRQYPSNIPGKKDIKELQKNSHIGHRIDTTVKDNVKAKNLFHGRSNIISSTNCKHITPATLYTLETWFVSGI